jgi:hypothetical protein
MPSAFFSFAAAQVPSNASWPPPGSRPHLLNSQQLIFGAIAIPPLESFYSQYPLDTGGTLDKIHTFLIGFRRAKIIVSQMARQHGDCAKKIVRYDKISFFYFRLKFQATEPITNGCTNFGILFERQVFRPFLHQVREYGGYFLEWIKSEVY